MRLCTVLAVWELLAERQTPGSCHHHREHRGRTVHFTSGQSERVSSQHPSELRNAGPAPGHSTESSKRTPCTFQRSQLGTGDWHREKLRHRVLYRVSPTPLFRTNVTKAHTCCKEFQRKSIFCGLFYILRSVEWSISRFGVK